ncbi:DNase I-like protein [Jaminaea rosea]|uniref:DNase I-like protein n=1 Tax=Jaminaea rosea TaxID=1569628 RepID=A0A316ULF5_9BASI|nr:DNase I-like protein [Jaminaea rosea]PWN26070.1 DNase I-like protein [Jaminaea rosea]
MTRSASNSSAAVGDSSSSDDEDDLEIPVASSSLSLASSSAAANSARLPATTAPPPLAYSTADTLPDASRANRRPPFFSPRRYATSKHVTCSAVAGHTICLASGDKVRVYRVGPTATSTSEKLCSLVAEKGGKEVKITTMAFRPDERNEGRFLWCGTKEGQIWEMDIAHALVTNVRQNVHTAPVVLMERMGGDMLTMDESGKICIWSAAKEKGHLDLARQPVSQRIALEKTAVVLALGHQLWVCAGGGGVGVTSPPLSASGPFHATSRPIGLGDMAKASSSGPIGAISCGTLLQSDPSRAYLGHDSGHISVWDRKKMICVAVQKLNVLGFTALCGVGTFLWAGNRSGRITVYQPSYLEGQHWQVIKSWPAHKHGVNAIWVDTTALREGGGGNQASDEADALALPVASAGMDYRVEIWDGTLTHDYIAHRLAKRVGEFSTYRRLRSLHITFNIDAAPASALNGSVTAMDWLPQVLASSNTPPDLIYIGFQEVVDLEDKSLTAKSMLLNATKGKSRAKTQVNERISHQYREWQSRLIQSIRLAMPPDVPYTTVHTETLVGLLSCMFVRSDQMHSVRDVGLSTIKCGLGGRWGNKGAILSRVTIDDTSCCFINAHLAAGQKHVKQRNADVAQIMEAEALPASISDGSDGGGAADADVVYVSGGDGQLVLDHELVFLGGDLNYRIDLPRSQVINAIERRDWPLLQERDQLTLELRKNAPTFRLRGFREAGEKEWGPTYKFDRGSGTYDSSEKKRAPAWCDRLLYRDALAGEDESSTPRVKCLQYRSWSELQISDHRPVSCVYEFQVKRVDREKREVVRIEEAARGQGKIGELLEEARRFYASVATP